MGVLLGLDLGVGLLLVWMALVGPPADRPPRRAGRLPDLMVRAGMPGTSVRGVILLCALAGVVTGLAIQMLTQTLPVSVAFAGMAAYLPVAALSARARRRQRELADVWPEAVDHLSSAVRAGMSLPEALSQLGHRGPTPLRASFQAFAADYQVTGRFGDCLDRLKSRLADPVGDRVVEALRVAREVGGGDLGRVLRSLSAFLRDDGRTRSELESRQSWTVNGARLAVAAPWLVLLMMSFQRDVISRYASTAGVFVLGLGAMVCLVAYRLMIRIGRLPTERRVLS